MPSSALPDVLAVTPVVHRPDATVRPPGSKSITNRALLCAALAPGRSTLTGVLFADDTRAMLSCVEALGARVEADERTCTVAVTGIDPRSADPAMVHARQSGTTSRFVLPVLALGSSRRVLDGDPQLRDRPFGPLVAALRELGAVVDEPLRADHLPLAVTGPVLGGRVRLPGHLSSQFLSGLLLAAPLMRDGLSVELTSTLVSVPYVTMTAAVMAAFGVDVDGVGNGSVDGLRVAPGAYRPADFAVEPDASAASYFLAAAAVTGGRITVAGLGTASLQGDVRFADVLERMGARVERAESQITVTGTGTLRGVDVDMADISDTAQTLAAVAVYAEGPTRVRGIGFIRGKETDRVGAVVAELRRAGIDAVEHEDGFTIYPGTPAPTRFATYDDHRMAMSLALLGLRTPGIEIAGPRCVSKTYPGYFTDLAAVRG
ncbi:3-phosphoshikimate 1-carboxyvinyltransferase [Catellatospora sp. TT07R-123]|uniref:3-phosphoshikimate 1-carboxyvinyltransferase n=1 Tax=Catellatospora sp. TT07R-123 TaxID=2733863 RepID=UPI001B1DFB22|nr:3-phosphoshikimate 1-carboxyvinyltransferase [Catellatospora sp. TT07R-123]GHJ44545.1 3-phosphoshikimate 1-carboxyvinyltransferase [Catellatospora sp. TT07R-123]